MKNNRSEFAANVALSRQPGRRKTVSIVQPETTVFNLVSDNPALNALVIGFALVASLVSIGATAANFFGR